MHNSIKNLINLKTNIQLETDSYQKIKIIAVSKTFPMRQIMPLIDYGHVDFGENKVQEAIEKWSEVKKLNKNINLHLIGRLQSNKVKQAVKIFDYIHSLDSMKLAKKIYDTQQEQSKKINIFIQVNMAKEEHKSGVQEPDLKALLEYSLGLGLNIVGLMCIPPATEDPNQYFHQLKILNDQFGLKELSMGMSADYKIAIKNNATYIRIGSNIFGKRG